MNASDTAKIQRYLRQRFGNHKLSIARRETKDDSAELMLEDEFIGVVFQDDEDGETCYHVQSQSLRRIWRTFDPDHAVSHLARSIHLPAASTVPEQT